MSQVHYPRRNGWLLHDGLVHCQLRVLSETHMIMCGWAKAALEGMAKQRVATAVSMFASLCLRMGGK